jgi:hypothetical protein
MIDIQVIIKSEAVGTANRSTVVRVLHSKDPKVLVCPCGTPDFIV